MKLKKYLFNYHDDIIRGINLPSNWEMTRMKSGGQLKFKVAPFGDTNNICVVEVNVMDDNPDNQMMFSINAPIEKDNFRLECLEVLRKIQRHQKSISNALTAKSLAMKL